MGAPLMESLSVQLPSHRNPCTLGIVHSPQLKFQGFDML